MQLDDVAGVGKWGGHLRKGSDAVGGGERAGGEQAEVALQAAGLGGQAAGKGRGLALSGAVEPDQAGDQAEVVWTGLEGDPSAALVVAGNLDAGRAGDAVGDLGPLLPGQ